MKMLALSLVVIFFPSSSKAIIFGDDDRLERFELKDPIFLKYSQSTAALMYRDRLKKRTGTRAKTVSFGVDFNAAGNGRVIENPSCPNRFKGQPHLISFCSSTLIASDILLTAGHCFTRGSAQRPIDVCKSTYAVFDYAYKKKGQEPLRFSKDDVYECSDLLINYDNDYYDISLIKLDRPVKGRFPLKVRGYKNEGHLYPGMKVWNSAYPDGLANKNNVGEFMHYSKNAPHFGIAQFDIRGGSSGSSVVDPRTLEIIGLVSAMSGSCDDLEWVKEKQCLREKVDAGKCNGIMISLTEKLYPFIEPYLQKIDKRRQR